MDRFDSEAEVIASDPHKRRNLDNDFAAWGRSLYAEGMAAGRAEACPECARKDDAIRQALRDWDMGASEDFPQGLDADTVKRLRSALALPEKPAPDDGGKDGAGKPQEKP